MTAITAKLRYLRVAPKKIRPLAEAIKGLTLSQAQAQLKIFHRQASGPLIKLLESAAANAENNFRIPRQELYVKEMRVDAGPTFKRFLPRAMGRATPINKRTAHITLILASRAKVIKEKLPRKIGELKPTPEIIAAQPEEEKKPEKVPVAKKRRLPQFKIRRPHLPAGISRRIFRRKAV